MNQNGFSDDHHHHLDDNEITVVDDDTAADEEKQLLEQILLNKTQLDFITGQLLSDPQNEEFHQLKSSLEELIQLLEGELLNVKKVKLLSQVNVQFGLPPEKSTESVQESTKNTQSQPRESTEEDHESIQNLIDELNGQECSVPFAFQNGIDEYQDAILKAPDDLAEDSVAENLQFKAFFLYPLTDSMLTCPFYLRGSCRFSSDSGTPCKYSHGIHVTVDQIRPKMSYSLGDQSSNSSKLCCLVKNSGLPQESRSQSQFDGNLWSRAEVVRTDEAKGRILVRLVKDQKDHWVLMEMMILVEAEFGDEDEEDGENLVDLETESATPTQLLNPSQFGEWERYTNGIGSKLLAKMGYQHGTGLGSESQGMLNPIESFVFPTGKSLDTCFQLKAESERKKTNIKEVLKEKARKLKEEQKRQRQYENLKDKKLKTNDSVFNFLDDMFYGTTGTADRSPLEKFKMPTSSNKPPKPIKALDTKSLTLSSFKLDEELRKAESELKKCSESYQRNVGKSDRSVVKQMLEKRDKQQAKVDCLRRKQADFGKEHQNRQNKDKLRFF